MVDIVLACDTNSNDAACQDTVEKILNQAGHKVEKLPIGPNEYATYSYTGNAKGKVGVYLMAASLISFLDGADGNFDYNIFGIRGDVTSWGTEEGFKTKGVPKDHHGDCTIPKCDEYQGKTYPELNQIYKGKCQAVPGENAEKLGQNIVAALNGEGIFGGSGEGEGTVGSGGGAQIKDKTFEKCIRRICSATDSVFLVENNVAVLFPYIDWLTFTLRQKISTITADEIDPEIFSLSYNTTGFYNKVSIAWGEATLPERYSDKNEANITNNYTLEDINKNITQLQNKKPKRDTTKSVINKTETTQEIITDKNGATILSEQYDSLVDKYGVLEKRIQSKAPDYETAQYLVNALLIQYVRDFNNKCECRTISNRKYIGGIFYAITNPYDKSVEIQYLNSYSIRKQKDIPFYYDLEFKYGPESPEELSDYQTYTGGTGGIASAQSTSLGDEGATINDIAKKAIGNETDPYKKAELVHNYLKQYIRYAYYECSKYGPDPEKCWQHHDGLNCADTANLTSACMRAAGLNAYVVLGPGHFWTVVEINGKEYASDLTANSGQLSRRNLGEVWEDMSYTSKCGKSASC